MPRKKSSNSKTKHQAIQLIELDGSQHLEQEKYDEESTKYLESLGYRVIPHADDVRFWNKDVMKNMDGVILAIVQALEDEPDKE